MKNMTRLLSALLFSFLIPACLSGKTILPISYRSGANPVIMLKVNGKGPFRFMFDTGSPGLLKLDETTFHLLALSETGTVLAGDGSGRNARTFPTTTVASVEIGDITITNVPAMVRNYNTRPGIDSIDGVIGLDFFRNYTVEFNFERNELIFSETALDKSDKQVSPLVFHESGVPSVQIRLGAKDAAAIFDTGNMGWLTLPSVFVTKEDMLSEPRVIGQARTVSNTFEIKEVQTAQTLQFGTVSFEKPVLILNDILPQINAGIRLLKQMNITFDLRNKLVKLYRYERMKNKEHTGPAQDEYTGNYGDRTITRDANGNYYIQRPGGALLKMIQKEKDRFGLEVVEGAAIQFERNETGIIIALKAIRPGGEWERATKDN